MKNGVNLYAIEKWNEAKYTKVPRNKPVHTTVHHTALWDPWGPGEGNNTHHTQMFWERNVLQVILRLKDAQHTTNSKPQHQTKYK